LQGFGWDARRKEPLRKSKRRWKDKVNMEVREIGIGGANWIRLAQDRVHWRAFVSTVIYIRVP
jgi:hypothetical protein